MRLARDKKHARELKKRLVKQPDSAEGNQQQRNGQNRHSQQIRCLSTDNHCAGTRATTCHLSISTPIGAINTLNAPSSNAADRRRMWRIILSTGLEAREKWRDFGGTGANSGDRGAGKGARPTK